MSLSVAVVVWFLYCTNFSVEAVTEKVVNLSSSECSTLSEGETQTTKTAALQTGLR